MRVLHVLSQRPGRTGSGVTLDAIVRETERAGGYDQHVAVGVPVGDEPEVGGLGAGRIHPLRFGSGGDLPFPVPGMSDVMPYESTVFGQMTAQQLDAYRAAWRAHLGRLGEALRPEVVHVHHLWLVGALVRDAIPGAAVVGHCHATGLRQMDLVPALAEEAREGARRHDRFAVLHGDHRTRLVEVLGVPSDHIAVVGAGFREDVFPAADPPERVPDRVAYAGKLSRSKGVPALLDAFEALRARRPGLELHMAGGGSGPEADALRARCADLGVQHHGFVSDLELARMLASSAVFVLPSYYEGLPLALVEAAASGCRLVSTALPGVVQELAPPLGSLLEMVPLPELAGVDEPTAAGERAHAAALGAALDRSLDRPPAAAPDLTLFRWAAVAGRVRHLWSEATRS